MSLRLGLCCIFKEEPIKFGSTTVTHILKMERAQALKKLSSLCLGNANSLLEALRYCAKNGIGCFRVNSGILPCYTHPDAGYTVDDLPEGKELVAQFEVCGAFARDKGIRLCFHPDQFVVMNARQSKVLQQAILEIEYQTMVAQWIGADVINIHGGGAYGDKRASLADLCANFYKLSMEARKLLTLENDDRVYTPQDLLPVCENLGVPLLYDVHHHRINGDEYSIQEATRLALATWDREPMLHISSPKNGWGEKDENSHHDFINATDFPDCWRGLTATVEVEAKAKELAVLKLLKEVNG